MDLTILSRFAYSVDCTVAVYADRDGKVRVSHRDRPEPLPELGPTPSPADSVAVSRDNQLVATGHTDGGVFFWEADTGTFRYGYRPTDTPVTRVVFAADSRQVASGSADGMIAVWDIEARQGRSMSVSAAGAVTSLAFSPSGEHLAVGMADGHIAAGLAGTPDSFVVFPAHQAQVFSLMYAPDETFLVSGAEDGTASTWRAATGEKIADRAGESAAITAIAVSPDGGWVATGDEITRVALWDPRTGQVHHVFAPEYAGPIAWLEVGADGSLDALPGPIPPETVNIAPDGRLTLSPPIGQESLMMSSDGQIIGTPATVASIDMASTYHFAAGAWDGTVALWDLRAQRLTTSYAGAGGTGQRVTFAPDGDLLALTSGDNTVRILDTRSGECLTTLFFDCLVTASFATGPPLTLLVGDRAGRIFEYEIANRDGREAP